MRMENLCDRDTSSRFIDTRGIRRQRHKHVECNCMRKYLIKLLILHFFNKDVQLNSHSMGLSEPAMLDFSTSLASMSL